AIVIVTVPAYGRLLSSLRLVRLARLMRLVRAAVIVSRALQAERHLTRASVDTGDFKTFWDGVWWAVVTVTTVGYGDVYPTTVAGRVVAIALMLVGVR